VSGVRAPQREVQTRMSSRSELRENIQCGSMMLCHAHVMVPHVTMPASIATPFMSLPRHMLWQAPHSGTRETPSRHSGTKEVRRLTRRARYYVGKRPSEMPREAA